MNPQEFLLLFDGFTAAVEGKPNAKQWAGLLEQRAKVETRDAGPAMATRCPAPASAPAAPPVLDEQSWRDFLRQALGNLGCPPEDVDFLAKNEPYNPDIKPADAARAAFSVE
jgi:hypothetical protein